MLCGGSGVLCQRSPNKTQTVSISSFSIFFLSLSQWCDCTLPDGWAAVRHSPRQSYFAVFLGALNAPFPFFFI